MSWSDFIEKFNKENTSHKLEHIQTLESAVTASWGVKWNEEFIARDIMQNFYDANKNCVSDIEIKVEKSDVIISAPSPFNLKKLFYIGSEKTNDDIGQYGEGFKAAAMCLLRDHDVSPVAVSGSQVLHIRVADEHVEDTTLKPVFYDFYESSAELKGAQLLLFNCKKGLVSALEKGLNHFLYPQNPLLGEELWNNGSDYAIHRAADNQGYVFYKNLLRGHIESVPLVLIINKEYANIETYIAADRDRNAFGGDLMKKFYNLFARYGLKNSTKGQRIVVEATKKIWKAGHPFLSEIASHVYTAHYTRHTNWKEDETNRIFEDKYFARHKGYYRGDWTEEQIQQVERTWKNAGLIPLPAYFKSFGVRDPVSHLEEMKQRAHEERKENEQRTPTNAESRCLDVLRQVLVELSPELKAIVTNRRIDYTIIESEVLLGELKNTRGHRSLDVHFSSTLFGGSFAQAFSVFLHEHSHVFGYDGNRSFSDALTYLIENCIEHRRDFDDFEMQWVEAQSKVIEERGTEISNQDAVRKKLDKMSKRELKEAFEKLPRNIALKVLPS